MTTYRPTNEDCLMRIVTSPNFCKVCLEALWFALLSKTKLIDGIIQTCKGKKKHIDLSLVPLAQLRETALPLKPGSNEALKESYTIEWFKQGLRLDAFANKTTLVVGEKIPSEERIGYSVKVKYTTEEIRKDQPGLTSDTMEFEVGNECGI
jgi:hypothetical protein